MLSRYDGVIHLVTAADGAPAFYKSGLVKDDSGGEVHRRETAAEAITSDRKLRRAWAAHPGHVAIENSGSFESKIGAATEAVLTIARATHPAEWHEAHEGEARRRLKAAGLAVSAVA
mgnify:CR=1 FL=1